MQVLRRLGILALLMTIGGAGCQIKKQNDRKPISEANSEVIDTSMSPEVLLVMHRDLKSCNSCHSKDRPPEPHDQTADCVSCHSYPAFKSTLNALTHDPKPDSCMSCHEKDRPLAPHVLQEDCVGCHSFPKFNIALSPFNHAPTPASCNSCHEKNRPSAPHIATKDCASCHAFPSFTRLAFTHLPKPAVCEDCHTRPATVGRRAYPNQGPPAGFVANDPKAIGARHYVGKDCSSCHRTPDEGANAFSFSHSTPRADYCLPCHFNDGRQEHLNDNRANFLGFGNCFNCHKNFDVNVNRSWGRGNN